MAKAHAEKFAELFTASPDCYGLCLQQDPTRDYENTYNKFDDVASAPHFGFDPNSMSLYLKGVPLPVTRWEILEAVKETRGFVSLSMSDPLKANDFERYAWLTYDSEDACLNAKEVLEKKVLPLYRFAPVKNTGVRKAVHTSPPLMESHIKRDLELCQKLISEVFDPEKDITPAVFEKLQDFASRSLSPAQHLDLLLLYLRRVHAYCLYCGEDYEDERTLAAKCGPQHLRNTSDRLEHSSARFEEAYTSAARDRLAKGPREVVSPHEDPRLKQLKQEYVEKKTLMVQANSVYQCGGCDKKFKTQEFVHKHFFNKHPEILDQRFNAGFFSMLTRENYFGDPKKQVNQPVAPPPRENQFGGRGSYPQARGRGRFDGGRGYTDYDDPSRYPQNPERQLVSYDDLF